MTRITMEHIAGGVLSFPANWWDEINESVEWQDGIFYSLCAAFGLVSAVALVCIYNPMYMTL